MISDVNNNNGDKVLKYSKRINLKIIFLDNKIFKKLQKNLKFPFQKKMLKIKKNMKEFYHLEVKRKK